MKAKRDESGVWVLVLDRGEVLRETIETWAQENAIQGASFQAIGALEKVELGYYHLEKGEYHRGVLKGDYELVSCDGNISLKDGKPFLHIHTALGGEDFKLVGGHCFDATVAVTMECFVTPLSMPLERHYCPEVKLPTINL